MEMKNARLPLAFSIALWVGLPFALYAQPINQNQPLPERVPEHLAPPDRVPEHTKVVRDLAYVQNGHARQKLDLYLPEESAGPFPLIIWVHGGGWQTGSKARSLALRLNFTGRGYAIASLDYRLSDDAIFPAQIEDCQAAVRWLREHAKAYNLDPERFAAWGSSAGGHLVALLGTAGDSMEFLPTPAPKTSSRVQAVCDFYGPVDLSRFVVTPGYTDHAKPDSPESKLLGGPVLAIPAKAKRANPIAYITPGCPPFHIVHGAEDPLVPPAQGELLNAALKVTGIESSYRTIPRAKHGGPEFETIAIADEVDAFFRHQLRLAPANTQ